MSKRKSLAGAAAKATTVKKTQATATNSNLVNYRHLQTRVTATDARRFLAAAEDNGYGRSVQTLLVEAINKLLIEWGEPPIIDVGSTGKKQTDNRFS